MYLERVFSMAERVWAWSEVARRGSIEFRDPGGGDAWVIGGVTYGGGPVGWGSSVWTCFSVLSMGLSTTWRGALSSDVTMIFSDE